MHRVMLVVHPFYHSAVGTSFLPDAPKDGWMGGLRGRSYNNVFLFGNMPLERHYFIQNKIKCQEISWKYQENIALTATYLTIPSM